MAITAEKYIPDSGSVKVNGVELNGSVKTVTPTAPRRAERKVTSLGGNITELQDQNKAGDIEITIRAYDDKSLAHTVTSASILHVMHSAYESNTPLTSFVVIPAGSTTGMAEYTYGGDLHVVQCPPHAALDAATDEEAAVDITLIAQTIAVADAL